MKSRKVIITIEVKTNAPLDLVRKVYGLNRELSDMARLNYYDIEVHQAHVQVVKGDK